VQRDRFSEWFVPKFGPRNFRLCCGILFLPYTGMVVSFVVWGSLVENFSVERLVAISVLYFLALGVSAHCLDAMGSKSKPWGVLSKKKIMVVSLVSLSVACVIGVYYAFLDSPLLFPIGIAEVFFLFAYNLELFGGRFHNNLVFVISWGALPVFAGSAIQTNTILLQELAAAGIASLLSYVLIKTSKKYKKLRLESSDNFTIHKQEIILKLVSIGVIAFTISYVILRMLN
jgi:asparagine N-glycosylation enzyme membrane subunit Stt3